MFFVSHTMPCSKCIVGLPFVLGKAPDYPDSRIGFQKESGLEQKEDLVMLISGIPAFSFLFLLREGSILQGTTRIRRKKHVSVLPGSASFVLELVCTSS